MNDRQRRTPLVAASINIAGGRGRGQARSVPRSLVEERLLRIVEDLLAASGALDLLGLNEVEFDSDRSGNLDQAAFIAAALRHRLGHEFRVFRSLSLARTGRRRTTWGNALLTRLPPTLSESFTFQEHARAFHLQWADRLQARQLWSRWSGEIRGFVRLRCQVASRPLEVVLTHLEAFSRRERTAQAAYLAQRVVDPSQATVLLGDLNSPPAYGRQSLLLGRDGVHSQLQAALVDGRGKALRLVGGRPPELPTYPAHRPNLALDHIYVSQDVEVAELGVVPTSATDHLGVYCKLRL